MKNKIGILDLKISNVESISSAINFLGFEVSIINFSDDLKKYSKIILPGCGSFPAAVEKLKSKNFKLRINEYMKNNKVLGICLGLQVFAESSEEFNKTKGLGIINNKVIRLNFMKKLPNVGFRKILIKNKDFLFDNIKNKSEFYFMHSYGMQNFNNKNTTSVLYSEKKEIITSISIKNFHGVQFHPEKSGNNGLKFLYNFAK